jgi:hypothetical protein
VDVLVVVAEARATETGWTVQEVRSSAEEVAMDPLRRIVPA